MTQNAFTSLISLPVVNIPMLFVVVMSLLKKVEIIGLQLLREQFETLNHYKRQVSRNKCMNLLEKRFVLDDIAYSSEVLTVNNDLSSSIILVNLLLCFVESLLITFK
ncbi:hypothetical protein RO3G_08390 [Rhizopus delemar RA 99-880]|uniref:Uncharacterized protein n=1 Tax=Rhizopus delemar (strain RA 99-880 / ATCC MYA-4621 / FGSC 9543 / NRRL 43880) TaxID=246409 RepID=I1C5F5_RHIO9|nr:hypothetical protein RO3G_08390 [Rhizopus delemar RA 99-880]|eukprot:EIE83685.1 hypothetical protein RO3G_08390 [Rhizopus delemar RA 99-880]